MATVSNEQLNEKFKTLQSALKGLKDTQSGRDLYAHLQDVFKMLILHYPDQALHKLEEVSYLLKHADKFQLEQFLKLKDMRNYKDVCAQMDAYIKQMQEVFGGKKPPAEGEEEEEV